MLLILFAGLEAKAYHIAGGDFTYQWVGGNFFQLKLTLYRDCSNPNAAPFDDSIKVSVYDKVTNAMQTGFVMSLGIVDELQLAGSGCVQPPEVCLEYGEYIETITLPDNPNGYYVVWERCCRNNTIININLPDQAGMAFYAEIADPALHNSSPVFDNLIVPVFCVNEFFRFTYSATDIDGDSLVYSLVDPLDGGHTSQFQPGPFSYLPTGNTPVFPDPAPYATVNWASGYSLNNLCGSNLPLTLNTATGQIEVQPDYQGIYAMAIEIREYRNGVLIGLIRREIEFTVLVCNTNSAPQLPPNYTGTADIYVYASDTVNIQMQIIDSNGDSIFLTRNGDIFSNSANIVIDPPYAVSPDTTGKDTLNTYLTWNTGCQHIASDPYLISYEATDNGCPLFLTDVGKIQIHVQHPPLIAKSNLVCIDLVNDSILAISRVSDTAFNQRYFDKFILYRSVNGSPFTAYKTITDINPLVIIDSAAYNNKDNDYCYALSSYNNCGEQSEWSDTLCSVSHINTHKNYIESVSVTGKDEITISWEYFNDGPYAIYTIYRAENDSVLNPSLIKTLTSYTGFSWEDHNVSTSTSSYCYFMINEDQCGNVSDTSLIACSILLSGESQYYSHKLNWTPYINFKGGTDHYEVQRMGLDQLTGFNNIASVPFADLVYYDRDMDRENGRFIYKIEAIEGQGGNNARAFSNEIELQQGPVIFLPNAFTPNGDGVNDLYFTESSFIAEFNMVIYNRWGRPVFSSTDMNQRWSGIENGKQAPTGVYFYKIQYKGFEDKSFRELNGSITLIR